MRGLIAGRDALILVIGEKGSGKTTFLNRYLDTSQGTWQHCRIRLDAAAEERYPASHRVHTCSAYTRHDNSRRTLIIDDAHLLGAAQLKTLLKKLLPVAPFEQTNRLVLFGEPSLNTSLTAYGKILDDDIAVCKIFIPVLTQAETRAYLHHRMAVTGASPLKMFNRRVVKELHRTSAGIPGLINASANKILQKHASSTVRLSPEGKPKPVGPFRRFLNEITAAGDILSVGALFQPNRTENCPRSQKMMSSRKISKDDISTARQSPAFIDRDPVPESRHNFVSADSGAGVLHGPTTAEFDACPSVDASDPGQKAVAGQIIYREDWLLCQDPAYFTIQVLGARSERAIAGIVKTHQLPSDRQVASYRTPYKGGIAYPLLWGIYSSRWEANAALKDLPEKLREFLPLVRSISAIQQAINDSISS